MDNDWRYSKERLDLRAKSLLVLGKAFELNREVYEFCDMWISQGGKDISNIVKEFNNYIGDMEVLIHNEAEACKKSCGENTKEGKKAL